LFDGLGGDVLFPFVHLMGPMEYFHFAAAVLNQGGTAFHPVTGIAVTHAVNVA